ncbi:MMPL family transporter [Arthrobacter halodurans]|uniref:MMPL family transporter n=1 Tax=Arthrobacter halodurans TaxID=516699 RepID=A0ABV4USR6_9MICC
MASFLYRLGRTAYRRRWWFVAAWTAVLLLIGVAAAAFMGTLSNSFSIPGTPTQLTLDKLKTELPEFAGGTGSIVYRAPDGTEFTAEQRDAVKTALTGLETLEDVEDVRDPFALQSDLDSAGETLAEARRELADGRARIEDGWAQLADGRKQLAEGRTEIADGKKRLAEGRKELESGAGQLEAAKSELANGRAELAAARAQVEDGQRKLAAGKARLSAGQRDYDAGIAQANAGAAQLADGARRLSAREAELAEGRRQYDAGVAELTGALGVATLTQAESALQAGQQRLDDTGAALDADEARLEAQDPAPEDLDARLAQIDAARADLAAQRRQLDGSAESVARLRATDRQLDDGAAALAAGRTDLKAQEGKLAEARSRLAAAKKELGAGWAEIAASERQVAGGAAELAAGEQELDDGAARVAANEARIAAGLREIEANEAELAAGERRLDAEEKRLPAAERELREAEAELADGEARLSVGERRAASTDGMRFISSDGSTAAVSVSFVGSTDALTPEVRERIQELAGAPEASGVEVYYSKEIVQDLSSVFGIAEIIGIAVAAVVLLVMLGTLVAAGLPLLMAILGVAAGVGGTLALSSVIEMASITPALALMLGLAVGIDYSLFIVHRHRRQLLDGMELEESIGRATGTSGNAVVFAGLTVVIALSALAVPGLPFLTILGLSAAFTVALSVLIAITLTPALLGVIGPRLISRRAWAKAGSAAASAARHGNDDGSRGWGAIVTRRPLLAAVVGVLVLAIAALPAAQLRTALPDGGAEPADSSAYQAYQRISDGFGGGYNGPIIVVADLPEGLDADAAEIKLLDVADRLRAIDGTVAAVPVGTNAANTVGVLQVIPSEGPASQATESLVHTLRDSSDAIEAGTGATIAPTGQVTAQIDVSEKLAQALVPYLAIVVGLSLILLLLVFRSVVVPLLATAGFLLSLAAAFGATVAVYQWGWLGDVFGVHNPGPIMSFLPILLTGILFGLAMDYQVFLVSGMREAYAHGGGARAAVRSGFAHAAPVVTAAALIMGSVFAGFVFSHMSMIRAIGFALAVGVLIDAFVVRMTITPAVMHLLGDKAWYIPRWLDRILPDVDVEGARLDNAAGRGAPWDGGDGDGRVPGDNDWFPFDDGDPDGHGEGRGKTTVGA